HVNGFEYPRLLRRLRRMLPDRCALIVQHHGGLDPARVSRARSWWYRAGLSITDAVLFSAPGQDAPFRRSHMVPPRLRVCHVMESSTIVQIAHCRLVNERPDALRVLSVGRLTANKDPLTLVRGFAAFAGRHSNAQLTMISGGGEDH